MRAFAPATIETTIEHLKDVITNVANDRLPPWFVQDMQGAELLAIIKTEGTRNSVKDHIQTGGHTEYNQEDRGQGDAA